MLTVSVSTCKVQPKLKAWKSKWICSIIKVQSFFRKWTRHLDSSHTSHAAKSKLSNWVTTGTHHVGFENVSIQYMYCQSVSVTAFVHTLFRLLQIPYNRRCTTTGIQSACQWHRRTCLNTALHHWWLARLKPRLEQVIMFGRVLYPTS